MCCRARAALSHPQTPRRQAGQCGSAVGRVGAWTDGQAGGWTGMTVAYSLWVWLPLLAPLTRAAGVSMPCPPPPHQPVPWRVLRSWDRPLCPEAVSAASRLRPRLPWAGIWCRWRHGTATPSGPALPPLAAAQARHSWQDKGGRRAGALVSPWWDLALQDVGHGVWWPGLCSGAANPITRPRPARLSPRKSSCRRVGSRSRLLLTDPVSNLHDRQSEGDLGGLLRVGSRNAPSASVTAYATCHGHQPCHPPQSCPQPTTRPAELSGQPSP